MFPPIGPGQYEYVLDHNSPYLPLLPANDPHTLLSYSSGTFPSISEVGAPIAGRLSDYLVVRYRAQRGGVWYPEDRLRATPYAFLLVPGSMFLSGFVTGTDYIENKTLGLGIYLFCLFVNGLGIDIVSSPSAAYFVDVMQKRSAESMAANRCAQSFLSSAGR